MADMNSKFRVESERHGDGCNVADCTAVVHWGDEWGEDWTTDDNDNLYCSEHNDCNPTSDNFVPVETDTEMDRLFLAAKIAQINRLIESLNDSETPIVWLAGDMSWGALPGLGLYLPEQIDQDMRDQYGMD